MIAEGERAQTREFGNDGEAAEIRAIKRRSSLRNYLDAASATSEPLRDTYRRERNSIAVVRMIAIRS